MREQSAYSQAFRMLVGAPLPSEVDFYHFGKSVQRPSTLPKESAEYRGWYESLPQTQDRDSAQYGDWYNALPNTKAKDSEAFRTWLRKVREGVSQRSTDMHQWHKSKPADASSNINAKLMWYKQKPSVYNARTGPDAKQQSGRAFGERMGAAIGKMVGASATPKARARSAASNAQEYMCQHCGYKTTMGHVKIAMVAHLGREENKQCLNLYSQSPDKREEVWVQLVYDPAIPAHCLCRQCGYTTRQSDAKRNMIRHLRHAQNKECLQLYSDSSDPQEMAWVRAVQER